MLYHGRRTLYLATHYKNGLIKTLLGIMSKKSKDTLAGFSWGMMYAGAMHFQDHYNYDGFVTNGQDNLGLSVFNEYIFGTETHCDNMELIPGFSSSPGIKIHSRHHCPTKPLSVSGPLSFTTIEEEAVLQCTTEE